MSCDAKIRPFTDLTELACEVELDGPHTHSSTLRDYAYPGSASVITWFEDDRRNYHGEWPGACFNCTLPVGHRGNHAP